MEPFILREFFKIMQQRTVNKIIVKVYLQFKLFAQSVPLTTYTHLEVKTHKSFNFKDFIYVFIYFRERGKEKGKERNIDV